MKTLKEQLLNESVGSVEKKFIAQFLRTINDLDEESENGGPICDEAYEYIEDVLRELTNDFENLTLGSTIKGILKDNLKY